MITREDLIISATELLKQHDAILLEFGTAVGKSKISLDLASGKILVVFKQVPHYNNWLLELQKWNITKDITFVSYDSLHKKAGTNWDYIILDESHAITPVRLDKLYEMTTSKWIFLSATVPFNKKKLLSELCKFKTVKFGLKEAIKNEMLPQGNLYIVNQFLDNTERNLIFKKHFKKYKDEITVNYSNRNNYRNVNLNIECTEQEYYYLIEEKLNYYKDLYFKERKDYLKIFWLRAGSERKAFINSLKTKTLKKLLTKLHEKRLIVFAHSAAQLQELGVDTFVYSNNKTGVNEQIISDFNAGITDKIYNLKILNEGMNLVNIEAGIITEFDGTSLNAVQRTGRVWRSLAPEVYFIKIAFTQDDKNFETLRTESGLEFKIINVNDL